MSTRLRILMVSKALVSGAYHKKLEALCELGVDLHVVIPRQWGIHRPEITKAKGYSIHLLPVLWSGRNHFHSYRHLRQLLHSVEPSIIHIDEESYSFVTFQIMRLAETLRIPALFFNWQNIYKNFPWPFSAFERYTMTHAAAGITGSQEALDVLRKKGCTIPLFVIPQFGVDTELFSKAPQNELRKSIADGNAFIVGFAGRFVKEKGIELGLTACSNLPEFVHVVLIGDGPEKKNLMNLAVRLGISKRVHFIDHVHSTDMPKWMNILDCLILPSLTRPNWKEQFGRVLIEAMACEVPVIGSDSGEIPRVIGEAGIIFPEGNAAALTDAIRTIMTDDQKKTALVKHGRQRVVEQFTQKKVARDTVDVYLRIIAANTNS